MHPKWVPQLADAAELMTELGERRAGDLPGAGAQRARPRPGPRARPAAHRDLRQRHRDLRAARTSTAPSTSSSRCSSRPCARARDAGLDVRAYVSMCFGDPWEGAVPIEQVVDGRQAAVRPRRQPAQPRRHHRRRHRRPRHGAGRGVRRRRRSAPTSSRCTSTTPTARRSPTPTPRCRQASPRSTPAPAASAAAPTPRAPPATSPPRTWSGCCTGLGIETGVDLDAGRRDQRLDGRPARPAQPVGRGPGARRPASGSHATAQSAHEPTSSTCTSAPRRPARPTSRTG